MPPYSTSRNAAPPPRDLYMNPFDFVPWFKNRQGVWAAETRTRKEWEGPLDRSQPSDRLLSGRLVLRLKALTPIHVSGELKVVDPTRGVAVDGRGRPQDREPQLSKRHAYRQVRQGEYWLCVPAASIKGTLRAFVEAATNGWFSALTTDYVARGNQRRHRPIHLLNDAVRDECALPPAYGIPRHFADKPADVLLDAASFLFGVVPAAPATPAGAGPAGRHSAANAHHAALAGRVQFSDVFFAEQTSRVWETSLDVKDTAPFGAANPRGNNFWYFTPGRFEYRPMPGGRDLLDPVGRWLRGRKFYFHQAPSNARRWYWETDRVNWRDRNPEIVEVKTECIGEEAVSEPFDVHFRGLPADALRLLLLAFLPRDRVRHKLGGLKPLGFGSVEFQLGGVYIDKPDLGGLSLDRESRCSELEAETNSKSFGQSLAKAGILSRDAWRWLRHILHWPENIKAEHRLFVYPHYRQNEAGQPPLDAVVQGFARPLVLRELRRNADLKGFFLRHPGWEANGFRDPAEVGEILDLIYKDFVLGKQPLDLARYQRNARNYEAVCRDAGLTKALVDKARDELAAR